MHPLKPGQRLPFRTPIFYGWVMVIVSALGLFFSGPGQTYSVSVFVDPLIREFGWSRSLVSGMYSLGTLCAGLLVPLTGSLVDRLGHRLVLPGVATGLALACLFMSIVANPWMLLVGFALIRYLGQGSMTLVSSTLVPQWFRTMRGRAMSLTALGIAVSTAAVPKLNTWLIETANWRFTWQVWAALLLLIMVPAALFLVRDTPETVGLRPDNAVQPPPTLDTTVDEEESWTLKAAMRTRAFWLLLVCTAIPGILNTGLIFHQVSILGARGIAPVVSATIFSVAVLIHLPMNFVAGPVLDRVPSRFVLAAVLAGHASLLIWIFLTNSVAMAISIGVFRGVIGAFEGVMGGVIWPAYFGRRNLGSIRGISMTAMVMGTALGPLPFGLAYDYFGGYQEMLLMALTLPLLGAVGAMFAVMPRSRQA